MLASGKDSFSSGLLVSLALHASFIAAFYVYCLPHLRYGNLDARTVFVSFENFVESTAIASSLNPQRFDSHSFFPQPVRVKPAVAAVKSLKPVASQKIKPQSSESVSPKTALENIGEAYNTPSTARNEGDGDRAAIGGSGGAVALYAPLPRYPIAAREMGFEGKVVLEVKIDVEGRAAAAQVLESSGRRDCDEAARKVILEKWRFKPSAKFGAPTESQERVVVVYDLV